MNLNPNLIPGNNEDDDDDDVPPPSKLQHPSSSSSGYESEDSSASEIDAESGVAHEGETGKVSQVNFHDREVKTVVIIRPGKQYQMCGWILQKGRLDMPLLVKIDLSHLDQVGKRSRIYFQIPLFPRIRLI